MARTYNNLFEQITDFEALHRAWGRVIRGRRSQTDVLRFERDLEPNLIALQESLLAGTYSTGPYRHFKVFEPKERAISALPLKDRIVQHALIEAIEPIWERRFIHDSYACRPGKGAHAGADRAQAMLRAVQREAGCVYVLKADIAKYFPSVSHDALKRLLRRRCACATWTTSRSWMATRRACMSCAARSTGSCMRISRCGSTARRRSSPSAPAAGRSISSATASGPRTGSCAATASGGCARR